MKRLSLKLLTFLVSSTLLGCGGGGGGSSGPSYTIDTFANTSGAPIELSENVISIEFSLNNPKTVEETTKYGTVTVLGENKYKYSIDPKYLVTYASMYNDDAITYPGLGITDSYDEIKFEDNDGNHKKVIINFFSDPLAWSQWHLRNIGKTTILPQNTEYTKNMVTGVDLNVMPAWVQGYTEKDIVVAVIDEDMEIAHEDLSSNVVPGKSYNVIDGSSDPSFDSSDSSLNEKGHGTAVSGILAASKNNKGGRGVAFDAKLIGYNLLHPKSTESESSILERILDLDNVHVINGSYGREDGRFIEKCIALEEFLVRSLAEKKVVPVRSMGNEYYDVDDECSQASYSSGTVDCFENFKGAFFESPFVITAGAMNSNGEKTSYGSTGTNLLVSAFGGDGPLIVTTDRTGCQIGYDESPTSDNSVYDSCKYSSNMDGTSSAAPEISGLVAILKSINPDLSNLQTKYILIKSTQKHAIEKMNRDQKVTTMLGSHNVINHDGWTTNRAGYKFNNKYGFGVPDSVVAVDIAKNCSKDVECARRAKLDDFVTANISEITSCQLVEEDTDYNHYRCQFNLSSLVDENEQKHPNMQIEDVALVFNNMVFKADNEECLSDYSASSYSYDDLYCRVFALLDTQIELTSPTSTHSILKHLKSITFAIDKGASMLSHAFYQETAKSSDVWQIDIKTKYKLDLTSNPVSFGFTVYGFDL